MKRTWTTYAQVHAGQWIQGAVEVLYVASVEMSGADYLVTLRDQQGHVRTIRRGPRQSVRVLVAD